MATLSSAEFRNQHGVANELKYLAAAFATSLLAVAAATGELAGALRCWRGSRCPCPGWLAWRDPPRTDGGLGCPALLGVEEGPVLLGSWQRRVCESRVALLGFPGSCEQRSWSAARPWSPGPVVPAVAGDGRLRGSGRERQPCAYRFGFWQAKPPPSLLQLFFPPDPAQLFPLLAWNRNIFYLPKNS